MFSLICVWINDWVNNRQAGDLRRYRAHYDVIVLAWICYQTSYHQISLHWCQCVLIAKKLTSVSTAVLPGVGVGVGVGVGGEGGGVGGGGGGGGGVGGWGAFNFEAIQSLYILSRGLETSRNLTIRQYISQQISTTEIYQIGTHNFRRRVVSFHDGWQRTCSQIQHLDETPVKRTDNMESSNSQIGRLSINWGPFHFRGIYCNWNSMENVILHSSKF